MLKVIKTKFYIKSNSSENITLTLTDGLYEDLMPKNRLRMLKSPEIFKGVFLIRSNSSIDLKKINRSSAKFLLNNTFPPKIKFDNYEANRFVAELGTARHGIIINFLKSNF